MSASTRTHKDASANLPYWLFLNCEWADTLASELVSLALVPADPALPEFYAERLVLPELPQARLCGHRREPRVERLTK